MVSSKEPDLNAVYSELKALMRRHAATLHVKTDNQTEFYVDTKHIQKNKKPLFFGAVQIRKHYVSYHLMPVYVDPGLLEGMSGELKRRMQGKACFNFTRVDRGLFRELAILTRAGLVSYKERGFV